MKRRSSLRRHPWVAFGVVLLTVGCKDAETPTGVGAAGSGGEPTGAAAGGAASGGATGSGGSGAAAQSFCETCAEPDALGTVTSPAINEASGLVAHSTQDAFFTHNDSGDSARFFAVAHDGGLLGTFSLTGETAIDWEDIARGPCDAGTCLFIGDFGDNDEERDDLAIYRVSEPSRLSDASITAERLPFRYEDGPHDAEALIVHPQDGTLTILTKDLNDDAGIYTLPAELSTSVEAVATRTGSFKTGSLIPAVTAADYHPEGKGILVRTYLNVWYYEGTADEDPAAILGREPCEMPVAGEPQGESVAWLIDGSGFVTLSEETDRPLNRVACASP